jgi:hypothetical protein
MSDYVQTAMKRWPGLEVRGFGRYACVRGGVVYLYEQHYQAEATEIRPEVYQLNTVVDLEPSYVPECKGEIGWE